MQNCAIFHFNKFVYAVETRGLVGGGGRLGEESTVNWPWLLRWYRNLVVRLALFVAPGGMGS